MNKRLIGDFYEIKAIEYLENQGVKVLEKNYRNRYGEIDIIAIDGSYLVFIEVKYRKTASAGYPEEAVNIHKANKISKVADYYRVVKKIPFDKSCRFDVIAIDSNEIRWHKNAFYYVSRH